MRKLLCSQQTKCRHKLRTSSVETRCVLTRPSASADTLERQRSAINCVGQSGGSWGERLVQVGSDITNGTIHFCLREVLRFQCDCVVEASAYKSGQAPSANNLAGEMCRKFAATSFHFRLPYQANWLKCPDREEDATTLQVPASGA
jgi:hypothetical protein